MMITAALYNSISFQILNELSVSLLNSSVAFGKLRLISLL